MDKGTTCARTIERESATRGNHRDMQTAQMAARCSPRLTRGIGREKGRKTREAAVMLATTRAGMRFSGPESRDRAWTVCGDASGGCDAAGERWNGAGCGFVPSPTGTLHVGGARTALFNYLYAKKMVVDLRLGWRIRIRRGRRGRARRA